MKRTVTVGDKEYGNLWLAPMAGDGDHAFRSICKKHGADYLCSEMVSAKAICYGDKKTPTLAKITPEEVPMAVQLFGSEPEFMAEAAKKILKPYAQSLIQYAKTGSSSKPILYININLVSKPIANGQRERMESSIIILTNISNTKIITSIKNKVLNLIRSLVTDLLIIHIPAAEYVSFGR